MNVNVYVCCLFVYILYIVQVYGYNDFPPPRFH